MKRVDYRTDNIFDGGQIQIRDRSLRISFPAIPSGFSQSQDIVPDECCSEAPGQHLIDAAADLLAFFDKWYGAGGRSTVDGFYIWSNVNCQPPGHLRVPTASHLDDVSQPAALCGDPPELFAAFNAMMDATVHMAALVRRRPKSASFGAVACPSEIDCKGLDQFHIKFLPIRRCEKPSPCVFDATPGSIGRSSAKPGEKLCVAHYIELEEIIDEIMTDGVVPISYGNGVLVKSGTPCGTPFSDDVECVEIDHTAYKESVKTSCCDRGDCCFGPTSNISDLVFIGLEGKYPTGQDFCCWCSFCSQNCPTTPMALTDIENWGIGANRITYTQNGASTFNFDGTGECVMCSWEVPCAVTNRWINMWGCDDDSCDFTREDQVFDDQTITVWWDINDGGWRIGAGTQSSNFAGNCSGITNSVGEENCREIGITMIIDAEWAELTCDPANSGCGSNCACRECTCPGDVDSIVTTENRPPIGRTNPATRYDIRNKCGFGDKIERSVSALIKYTRDCPDSGLTNIVMLDDRINTINGSTYTNTTLLAPALSHPGCPGENSKFCAGFECLSGYGELA